MTWQHPTTNQSNYLHALMRELRLSDDQLDRWCLDRFGKPRRQINKRETSLLIEQLVAWKASPAALLRWLGAVPLFGLEGVA